MTSLNLPGKLIRTDSWTYGLEHEFEREYTQEINNITQTYVKKTHTTIKKINQKTSVRNILDDKEKLTGSLVKSQLCSITDKNEECQDG